MALKNINILNSQINPETGLTQVPNQKTPFSPKEGIRFGGQYGIGKTDSDFLPIWKEIMSHLSLSHLTSDV
jgi:hypothetical protein